LRGFLKRGFKRRFQLEQVFCMSIDMAKLGCIFDISKGFDYKISTKKSGDFSPPSDVALFSL
jgi:hypothetical protein